MQGARRLVCDGDARITPRAERLPAIACAPAFPTRDEITEALGVAIAVNAGATLVYSARVMDAYAAKVPADQASPADRAEPAQPG